jgi:periplasmic protein TonB
LKDRINIPSLDDMVFEGRNQDYGAYRLRKSNQRRLLVSFGYAIGFFIIVLSIYPLENLFHPKIYDLGYNYRAVNVSMTYDPTIQIQTERSAGSSSASESIPDKIIDDDQVITPQQDAKLPSAGNSDSANAINNGTGSTGTGNSNIAGEGDAGEVFGSADVNPQFPGGPKAMQEFVNSNIHYPEIALSMNIRGTILVYVVIMSDGSLRDVKVVKGLQPELDAEVVRVVKSMPLWKPAMRAGIPVNVRCTWPITVSSKMGKM